MCQVFTNTFISFIMVVWKEIFREPSFINTLLSWWCVGGSSIYQVPFYEYIALQRDLENQNNVIRDDICMVTIIKTKICKVFTMLFGAQRACCLKDKYSPGDGRLYLKPKFDVTSLIKS